MLHQGLVCQQSLPSLLRKLRLDVMHVQTVVVLM